MHKLWEPIQYRPGQRVMVHLSLECDEEWEGAPGGVTGHPYGVDGAVGTILPPDSAWPAPWRDTHPYAVQFDRPVPCECHCIATGGYFAASELRPIGRMEG
jgi:hypothetical protein